MWAETDRAVGFGEWDEELGLDEVAGFGGLRFSLNFQLHLLISRYSLRRAIMGSTLVARRAGMRQARTATRTSGMAATR